MKPENHNLFNQKVTNRINTCLTLSWGTVEKVGRDTAGTLTISSFMIWHSPSHIPDPDTQQDHKAFYLLFSDAKKSISSSSSRLMSEIFLDTGATL